MIQIVVELLFFSALWWLLLRALARVGQPKPAALLRLRGPQHRRKMAYPSISLGPILMALISVFSAFLLAPEEGEGLSIKAAATSLVAMFFLGWLFVLQIRGAK